MSRGLARIMPAVTASVFRPGSVLGSYTMSADQTGISTSDVTVLFDTKDTTGIYRDLGTTDSAGVITIPAAAQAGFSFFRASAYIWSTGSGAFNNVKLVADWTGGVITSGQVLTRNSLDGSNWRTTTHTGWLPFGQLTAPYVYVAERGSDTSHSVLASGTAGHAITRLTLEFI